MLGLWPGHSGGDYLSLPPPRFQDFRGADCRQPEVTLVTKSSI